MNEEAGAGAGSTPAATPGLITEVPSHLRGQSAPTPTGRRFTSVDGRAGADSPPADVEQAQIHADGPVTPSAPSPPEERTRVRAPAGGPYDGSGSLRQPTGATVAAVWCPAGHFSPPDAPYCRVCGTPIPPQQPMRVPRPTLGALHLPEGDRVELDRGAILGRRPLPVPGGEPWPHLVELPAELTHLSRNHVAFELDGWHVLARDLGSSGGTTLHVPGRAPVRLRPHDPHVIEPGHCVVLSGDFAVTFAVASS